MLEQKSINVNLKGKTGRKMKIGFDNEEEIKQVIKFYFTENPRYERISYGNDFVDLKENIVVINDNIFEFADSIAERAMREFINNKKLFSDIFFIVNDNMLLSGVFIKDGSITNSFHFFNVNGKSILTMPMSLNFIPSGIVNRNIIIEFSKDFQVEISTKFNDESKLKGFFLKSA